MMNLPNQIPLLQTKIESKIHRLFCVFDSVDLGWVQWHVPICMPMHRFMKNMKKI